ncbi:conserved hypothetical protein [Neospora caninum Liverpool]|uniref:Uncharacterized protein n=1 Tax=Neospora caninum (strain Liverpool) TaxID=572307 RepID=F0VAF9_NEOCL|nr:conserved hypothetical protein [Neospora caninum Liverpool]CBZ50648.1 conserved hypothetical protein [Neospora caninum Liverpool]CEL65260.1 TPA: hypothetical protein BN1204_011160 [Neospora caninum Liverpool]|eukprot:XP_003880681.1 conserved hypothetical protein [Neospora caninum Liverpool]
MTQQWTGQPQRDRLHIPPAHPSAPVSLCAKNLEAKEDATAESAAHLRHLEAISPVFHGLESLQEEAFSSRNFWSDATRSDWVKPGDSLPYASSPLRPSAKTLDALATDRGEEGAREILDRCPNASNREHPETQEPDLHTFDARSFCPHEQLRCLSRPSSPACPPASRACSSPPHCSSSHAMDEDAREGEMADSRRGCLPLTGEAAPPAGRRSQREESAEIHYGTPSRPAAGQHSCRDESPASAGGLCASVAAGVDEASTVLRHSFEPQTGVETSRGLTGPQQEGRPENLAAVDSRSLRATRGGPCAAVSFPETAMGDTDHEREAEGLVAGGSETEMPQSSLSPRASSRNTCHSVSPREISVSSPPSCATSTMSAGASSVSAAQRSPETASVVGGDSDEAAPKSHLHASTLKAESLSEALSPASGLNGRLSSSLPASSVACAEGLRSPGGAQNPREVSESPSRLFPVDPTPRRLSPLRSCRRASERTETEPSRAAQLSPTETHVFPCGNCHEGSRSEAATLSSASFFSSIAEERAETTRLPSCLRPSGESPSPRRSASSLSPRSSFRHASPWAERGRVAAPVHREDAAGTPRLDKTGSGPSSPRTSRSLSVSREPSSPRPSRLTDQSSVCRSSSLGETLDASDLSPPFSLTPLRGRPRLILLDLDNTLIPTSWIMSQWRSKHCTLGPLETVAAIREALYEAKFFQVLGNFFASMRDVRNNGFSLSQVVIVTNAGTRTVENFYLQFCLPELGELCAREQVYIHSTEHVVKRLGPIPPITDEEAYREFYTTTKYHEFDFVLQRYIHGLRREHGALRRQQLSLHRRMRAERTGRSGPRVRSPGSSVAPDGDREEGRRVFPESPWTEDRDVERDRRGATVPSSPASAVKEDEADFSSEETETPSTEEETTSSSGEEHEAERGTRETRAAMPLPGDWRFDLLSAGDQACEIMAACRVAHQAGEDVVHLTKLLYLNDPDDPRYLAQTPERFVAQLVDFQEALLRLLDENEETLDSQGQPEWRKTGVFSSAAVSSPSRFFLPPLHCLEGHLEYVFTSTDEEVSEQKARRRRLNGRASREGHPKRRDRREKARNEGLTRTGRQPSRCAGEQPRQRRAEGDLDGPMGLGHDLRPGAQARAGEEQLTPGKRRIGAKASTSQAAERLGEAATPDWTASSVDRQATPAMGSVRPGPCVGARGRRKPFYPIASSVYYADRAYRSTRPLSHAFAGERVEGELVEESCDRRVGTRAQGRLAGDVEGPTEEPRVDAEREGMCVEGRDTGAASGRASSGEEKSRGKSPSREKSIPVSDFLVDAMLTTGIGEEEREGVSREGEEDTFLLAEEEIVMTDDAFGEEFAAEEDRSVFFLASEEEEEPVGEARSAGLEAEKKENVRAQFSQFFEDGETMVVETEHEDAVWTPDREDRRRTSCNRPSHLASLSPRDEKPTSDRGSRAQSLSEFATHAGPTGVPFRLSCSNSPAPFSASRSPRAKSLERTLSGFTSPSALRSPSCSPSYSPSPAS